MTNGLLAYSSNVIALLIHKLEKDNKNIFMSFGFNTLVIYVE